MEKYCFCLSDFPLGRILFYGRTKYLKQLGILVYEIELLLEIYSKVCGEMSIRGVKRKSITNLKFLLIIPLLPESQKSINYDLSM